MNKFYSYLRSFKDLPHSEYGIISALFYMGNQQEKGILRISLVSEKKITF